MAVYSYSEDTISRMIQRGKRARFWMRVVSAVWLALDLFAVIALALWFHGDPLKNEYWSSALFVLPFVMFMQSGNAGSAASKGVAEFLRTYSVGVSAYSVRIQSSLRPQRQFLREEILRAEESAWGPGLYLRTTNRYRCLVIPRNINGYSELRKELIAAGIPFTKRAIPGNWEDLAQALAFLGSLLFSGLIICDAVSRSPWVITVNFTAALLVGLVGFLTISGTQEGSPRMRLVKLASFLPLLFAILAQYLK